MDVLEIKGVRFGEGRPKSIISLMDATVAGCIETAKQGVQAGVECFEWRGDFAEAVHDHAAMAKDSQVLAEALPNNPLLFTFRSTSQGGNLTISVEEYVALNKAIIEAGAVDLIDVETWIGDANMLELVECAHQKGIKVIISYHNFVGTPSVEWMVNLMTHMDELGADIPKVATMATSAKDALNLLAATEEMSRVHTKKPLLTMAMGREGSITRLAGELFGSSITFCSLKKASAPGQVQVEQAIRMMDDLHTLL